MKPAAMAMGLCLAAGTGMAATSPLLGLMKQAVDPAANAFWAAGNDPPEGETPEAADVRWRAAADAAVKMQQYGELLTSPEHTRPGEWNAFARQMAEAGAAGLAAVERRDIDAAFEAGGQLYESCSSCHAKYIPGRGGG